jgi:hypothetical protein
MTTYLKRAMVCRMNKETAIAYLRHIILERFPPGPERHWWLNWLTEFSQYGLKPN